MSGQLIGIWFKPLMWLKKAAGLLRACFICPHVLTLAFLLMSAWVIGAVFAHHKLHEPNWGQWSLSHLFDLSATIDALNTTSTGGKVVAVLLYGTTWLIGGGILLGILIDNSREYFSKIRDGHFRYWRALRNHLVILGWEPNAISLLRDLTNEGESIPFWRVLRRHRIVIISEQPAEEIRRQIEEAIGRRPFKCFPFSLIVYNGQYDNKEEFRKTALKYARKIYVTGEEPEASHDTRVMLFLAELDRYLHDCKMGQEKVDCHVRIASYSLLRLLILAIKKDVKKEHHYEHLEVRFFNFYENWSKTVMPVDKNVISTYPSVVSEDSEEEEQQARLIVVGFGKMGQAMTVEAFRSHKRRDDKMLNITVVDPHVEEYIKQFNMSHSDIIEGDYKNYATLEAFSMRVEDDGFEKMVDGYVRDGAKITIVLTYESSDDAIVRAVALARRHKGANVFVRLNVDVPDAEQSKALLAERYKLSRIFPFGFRSGAGYGKCSTNLK